MAQHPLRGFSIAAAGFVAIASFAVVAMNILEGGMKWAAVGAGAVAVITVSVLAFLPPEAEPSTEHPAAPSGESSEEVMNTVRLAMVARKLADLQTAHDQLLAEHTGCKADRAESIAAHEAAMARSVALEADAFAMREEIERLRASVGEREPATVTDGAADVAAAAAAAEAAAALAARAAELERERDELKAECGRALVAERVAAHRIETLEQEARNALAIAADVPSLRTAAARAAELEAANGALRDQATRLAADLTADRARADAAEASVARLETTRRDDEAAATGARREQQAMRERVTRLEADLADAKRRGDAAQTALAQLETARAETAKRQTADAEQVRILTAELHEQAERSTRLADEVAALRASVIAAEDAVRAVLRELGVDAAHWPLTVAGVTQAVAPLTLLALGEDTPGWNANPDGDTLAAAIVHLAHDAADRRNQVERLSAAVARQPAARR